MGIIVDPDFLLVEKMRMGNEEALEAFVTKYYPKILKSERQHPDRLLQAGVTPGYFNLYTLGGKVLGAVPILLVLYTALTVILLPVLYRGYRRKQIS